MLRKILKILFIRVPLIAITASILLVVLLKWVPVAFTPLMIKRSFQGIAEKTEYKWVPLEKISPNLARAVIASEDNKFLEHNGFDFEEIEKMKKLHEKKGKPIRGCSTISQQTAKNCFTWCSRTWLRKGIEAYFTVLIEFLWGKERIMEVYLNIVELGPGVYGAEAASQKFFNREAAKLTLGQSSTLACCLPNPLKRTPKWVEKHMPNRKRAVERIAGDISWK